MRRIAKSKESYLYCMLRIACCVLVVVYLLYVVPDATGAEAQQIGSIRIVGNRTISNEQIRDKVRSRVGELFDSATADGDAKRIAELPGVEHSYYNIAVVDGKIQLTFVVVERNIVRSIDFVGNRKYKAKTLRKKTGFKRGD